MNSSAKKEARLFNLMKNLRDRKKKKKKKKKRKKKKRKKKNLLSFQGPSPLVCPIRTRCLRTKGHTFLNLSFICLGT
jgi:hypothetical protein